MKHRIETISEKKLVGKNLIISFSNNRTAELWSSFMPRRKEIKNNIDTKLYSMQMYKPLFFANFNPDEEFEKWAAVEVSNFNNVPEGMEAVTLPEGQYAVFLYKGNENNAEEYFKYIFGIWLHNSEYELDNRPHFEVLGDKYQRSNPNSEEEIWIPIKTKNNE